MPVNTSEHRKAAPSAEELLVNLAKASMPADPHTEEAVLSCAIQAPGWAAKHAPNIPVGAFATEAHRYIWEAVSALLVDDTPVDVHTVCLRLKAMGKLEAAGGHAKVTEIATAVMGAYNADAYLRPLVDMHIQRQHILAHARSLDLLMRTQVSEEQALADAVEANRQAVEDAGRVSGRRLARLTMGQAIEATMTEIQDRVQRGGALPGWPTGFSSVDERTGGLQKGRVTIFAGLPSDGKSAIMQNCARNALMAGARVGWYSLEMPIPEQTLRILAEHSGVDSGDLYKGILSRAQQDMLMRAVRELRDKGAVLVDTENATSADILADVERSDFDVVVIDYLQLLEPGEIRKGATREEVISSVSRKIKAVARRTGCHILSASQLNDQGRLRESRAIGQDADAVFLVNKCPMERKEGRAADADEAVEFDDARRLLWCEKNRGGKRHWELPLWFFGSTFTFKEVVASDNDT
jgi:replicative DNA helicase